MGVVTGPGVRLWESLGKSGEQRAAPVSAGRGRTAAGAAICTVVFSAASGRWCRADGRKPASFGHPTRPPPHPPRSGSCRGSGAAGVSPTPCGGGDERARGSGSLTAVGRTPAPIASATRARTRHSIRAAGATTPVSGRDFPAVSGRCSCSTAAADVAKVSRPGSAAAAISAAPRGCRATHPTFSRPRGRATGVATAGAPR